MVELPEGFLDIPIAVLERYGLDVRAINAMEEKWDAVYVKDLCYMTDADVSTDLGFFGKGYLVMLRKALRLLRWDMMNGGCADE